MENTETNVYDVTLPVDFNATSNPDLLTEVTYGELGLSPMMEKSGTGRMSPVRGRTMKEYDQQITELQKANFNLKLRIYFLEERMNIKSGEEDVIKYNIELKVEVEKYKQELKEKQDLLDKAAETINTLTASFSKELENQVMKIKSEYEDEIDRANKRVGELEDQVKMMEDCLKQTEEKYAEEHEELGDMMTELDDKNRLLENLKDKIAEYEEEMKELKLGAAGRERELEDKIEQLSSNVDRRDQDILRLSVMVQDDVPTVPRESISMLEKNKLQDEVEGKGRTIDRLEKELRSKLQIMEAQKESEKQATARMNKYRSMVQGLSDEYEKLQLEKNELADKVQLQALEVKHLQQQLDDVTAEKDKALNEAHGLKQAKQKDEEKIGNYEEELEKLSRSLGKKQGELDQFQELLRTAQASLEMSEDSVMSLQRQLEREKCKCKDKKTESDEVIELRQELDDLHKQLEDQDRAYRAKSEELDAVARQLNITVNNQPPATADPNTSSMGDNSDLMQRILEELNVLKGAVQADRHVHIDINSHSSMEAPNQQAPHDEKSPVSHSTSTHTSTSSHQSFHHEPASTSHSKIPRRRFPSQTSVGDISDLRRQVMELTAQNRDLQKKLEATEETVHCQTRKMNGYKNLLAQHGILSRSRSNSESNLARLDTPSEQSSPHSRARSLSPTPDRCTIRIADVGDEVQKLSMENHAGRVTKAGKEVEKLKKENYALKQQVEGYKRLLKVLKNRSPSPDYESSDSGQDGGSGTSDGATYVLEGYLDTLDKFLVDLVEADQSEEGPAYGRNTEVTRLRRGLVQARQAMQSLSEAMTRISPTQSHSPATSPVNQRSGVNLSREAGDHPDFGSELPYKGRGLGQEPDTLIYPDGDIGYGSQDSGSDRTAGSYSSHPLTNNAGSKFNSDENLMEFSHHDQFMLTSHMSQNNHEFVQPAGNGYLKSQNHHDLASDPKNVSVDTKSDNDFHEFARPMEKTPYNVVNLPLERLKGRHLRTPKFLSPLQSASDQSMMPESDVYDETLGQSFFNHNQEESSLNHTLDESRRNTANMKARISSLEDMIASYETQIRAKSCPDMDLLRQHLNELRQLRLELERSNRHNEMLEQELMDFKAYSEATIQDLEKQLHDVTNQLTQCHHEKMSLGRDCNEKVETANYKVEQCIKECKDKLNNLNSAMERCKRTCEQKMSQCMMVCEEKIEKCKVTWEERMEHCRKSCNEKLDQCQEQCQVICQQKDQKCSVMMDEYKLMMEQQRHKCADYKRQVDRQNQLLKDMKERAENMRQELEHASKNREMHEKQIAELKRELQECTKLRDRFKNNLTIVHTEMKRTKVKLREKEKEMEVSGMLNSSRLLNISQKLERGADRLTDDDKQSIIAQLLEELMHVREEMKKLLQQNNSNRLKMSELLKELREQKKRPDDANLYSDDKFENQNKLDGGSNHNFSSFTGSPSPLSDVPLASHPLRDITLGARNTLNSDSCGSSPLNSVDRSSNKTALQFSSPQITGQEGCSLAQYIKRTPQLNLTDELTGSRESLNTDSSRSDGHPSTGPHFSVPGPIYKQGITDNCLVYNVTDAPEKLAGLTQVKINSDLRSLFAVGMIDNFEKLKKETNESKAQLVNLSTRVTERLRILSRMSATESPEYSTLKEISYTTDNLRICVDSQYSMLDTFWTSELPAPNEKGEFVNQKLLDENNTLKERLTVVSEKYDRLISTKTEDLRRNDEQICKSLSTTLDKMTRAKQNLQHTHRTSSLGGQRSPSKSPRKHDFSF